MKSQTTLQHIRQRLDTLSDTPFLDSQVLLSHILERPRSWILAHPNIPLTPSQRKTLQQSLQKLEKGVPLPYVLGYWEFYNLRFKITPAVLIPRPETELIVDLAIEWLQAHPSRRSCADIGTGSGCIAISVAHHISDARFIASDISMDSLKLAKTNAIKHQVSQQIAFCQGHLLQAMRGRFDLILANLPYIPTLKLNGLDVGRQEPHQALNGGSNGLKYISELLSSAPPFLNKGGEIMLEIDGSQGPQAQQLGERTFPHAAVSIQKDLAGQDRVLLIQTGEP